MTDQVSNERGTNKRFVFWGSGLSLLAFFCVFWPQGTVNAITFAIKGLWTVSPIVVPGILLTAWIISSGADTSIARAFEGRTLKTVFVASFVGALTPICGVTVLPLMAGLIAAGVPLAPIIAFWLSSPITDPTMLAATTATLGVDFALGKTTAAFLLGLFGGGITALFSGKKWSRQALRTNGLVRNLNASGCCGAQSFEPWIWNSASRRGTFAKQFLATTQLILICLFPAFTAEYALNSMLTPGSLAEYVGDDKWWAIPAAVFIGGTGLHRWLCGIAAHSQSGRQRHVEWRRNGFFDIRRCSEYLGRVGHRSSPQTNTIRALSCTCGRRITLRGVCFWLDCLDWKRKNTDRNFAQSGQWLLKRHEHDLTVSNLTAVQLLKPLRTFNLSCGTFLEHANTSRFEPTALRGRFQSRLTKSLVIRRIGENQIERVDVSCTAKPCSVASEYLGRAVKAHCFHILADYTACFRAFLDKGAMARSAADRLKSKRPSSREQIQDPYAVKINIQPMCQNIENSLAQTITGWSCGLGLGRSQSCAFKPAGNNPHERPSAPWGTSTSRRPLAGVFISVGTVFLLLVVDKAVIAPDLALRQRARLIIEIFSRSRLGGQPKARPGRDLLLARTGILSFSSSVA